MVRARLALKPPLANTCLLVTNPGAALPVVNALSTVIKHLILTVLGLADSIRDFVIDLRIGHVGLGPLAIAVAEGHELNIRVNPGVLSVIEVAPLIEVFALLQGNLSHWIVARVLEANSIFLHFFVIALQIRAFVALCI